MTFSSIISWWRWRESNPRLKKHAHHIYILSRICCFFSSKPPNGQRRLPLQVFFLANVQNQAHERTPFYKSSKTQVGTCGLKGCYATCVCASVRQQLQHRLVCMQRKLHFCFWFFKFGQHQKSPICIDVFAF